MKTVKIFAVGILVIAVAAGLIFEFHHSSPAHPTSGSSPKIVKDSVDKTYSVDKADSLWVVVNKGRVLPASYAPANLIRPALPVRPNVTADEAQLRSDAAAAMEKMFQAAKNEGVNLMIASGYRSYATQVQVYAHWVQTDGQAQADATSARPGHSEHQTGLAADLEPASRQCEVAECFDATAEGKWVAANSYKYGFIIRYKKGTQQLTGYAYEPWHVRYIGTELAAKLNSSGQTLEQYFKLPAYQDYPAQSFQLE